MRTPIVLLVLGISMAFVSCKKDDSSGDARDKYVGIWTGTQRIVFPAFNLNNTYNVHYRVTKGANARQIMFFDLEDLATVYTATVDNSTFVFDTHVFADGSSGTLRTFEQSGTGQISGNIITENGTLVFKTIGTYLEGSWSQRLTMGSK